MNYRVKIGERVYDVEIQDLSQRPVVALVDGTRCEIWPDVLPEIHAGLPASPPPAQEKNQELLIQTVLAPMPGVIIAVAVQPGAQVTYGQELCTLEAMKMKNSIRAPRAGVIAKVHVSSGQTVKYRDLLIEYQED